ncbi:MAG: TIGR02587 family membrane protein [Gemmatimonadales bacterium]
MLDRSVKSSSGSPARRSTGESLREYGRGVAGGLLFSLPLLYTAELWQTGFAMPVGRMPALVFLTLLLLLGYNRYAGLRQDSSWIEVVIDSIEEMGLGLILSTFILYLLDRIGPEQPVHEIVGQIVVAAMTVAIGVSVGTAQLGGEESDAGKSGEIAVTLGGRLVLAWCGAVLFAANIAPTEEVLLLGAEISPLRLMALAGLSIALGAVILYSSDFRGSQGWAKAGGLGAVLQGTVITYAVALLASAAMLWTFGRLDGATLPTIAGEVVVLGLAGTLGASAGRLLLQ